MSTAGRFVFAFQGSPSTGRKSPGETRILPPGFWDLLAAWVAGHPAQVGKRAELFSCISGAPRAGNKVLLRVIQVAGWGRHQ